MPILVNGETIDDAAIRDEMAAMRPQYEEAMGEMEPFAREQQLKEWARENVIERTLLRQEALRDPSLATGEEEDGADQRIQRLIHLVRSKITLPKTKELGEYYRKHKKDFWMPEMVRAAHIVKHVDENHTEEQAREAAIEVRAKLEAGADFVELADENSDCPGSGGDLGWFGRGEMVEEFENVVFALEPGKYSDVFQTQFGFHIARVIEKRPEGIPEFPEVKKQIEAAVLEEKKQRALERYLDQLRAKADVQMV